MNVKIHKFDLKMSFNYLLEQANDGTKLISECEDECYYQMSVLVDPTEKKGLYEIAQTLGEKVRHVVSVRESLDYSFRRDWSMSNNPLAKRNSDGELVCWQETLSKGICENLKKIVTPESREQVIRMVRIIIGFLEVQLIYDIEMSGLKSGVFRKRIRSSKKIFEDLLSSI